MNESWGKIKCNNLKYINVLGTDLCDLLVSEEIHSREFLLSSSTWKGSASPSDSFLWGTRTELDWQSSPYKWHLLVDTFCTSCSNAEKNLRNNFAGTLVSRRKYHGGIIILATQLQTFFFIFHENLPTIIQNLIPIWIINQETLIIGSPFQSYFHRFLKCWQSILWRFENFLLRRTKLRKNELRSIRAFCENKSKNLLDFFSQFFVTFFRFHNQRFHCEKIGKTNHSWMKIE